MPEQDVTVEDFAFVEEWFALIGIRSDGDYFLRKYGDDLIVLPYTAQMYSLILGNVQMISIWIGALPQEYQNWGYETGYSVIFKGNKIVVVCP